MRRFSGFLRRGYARDALQVWSDLNVVPSRKKAANAFADGATDFHHQPAAGAERGPGLRNEALNDFKPGGAGEDGAAGLELADFKLDLIFLRIADIRRVGDDELETVGAKIREQIRLMEMDA